MWVWQTKRSLERIRGSGGYNQPGGTSGGYRPGGPSAGTTGPAGSTGPRPSGGTTDPAGSKRPGGRKEPDTATPDNRTASKKVFKAKKKPVYQKSKKNSLQEKDFQIKKKLSHKVNPVPKSIDNRGFITVSSLPERMNLKASELNSKLMSMGMM
jgi:ribosomal protein S25